MRRPLAVAAAVAGLAVYAALALGVYLARRDAEGYRNAWPPPSPSALNEAADSRLEAATRELAGPGGAAPRFAAYRAESAAAEPLVVRSLALLPAQPREIARLAALRWELDPPFGDAAERPLLALVETASAMAPRVPDVQFALGELLLRMGHAEEGAAYFRRTLEMVPLRAADAVRLLHGVGWREAEIAAALPETPDLLAALYDPAFEDGDGGDYVNRVEPHVADHLPALANYYGSACLRTNQAQRLAAFAEGLGPRPKAEDEAARLVQLARASLAMNRPADGVGPARRAAELAPTIHWVQEFAGQVVLAADRPDEAILLFRRALGTVAEFKGWDTYRASLYTQIGYAEERRFHPERAFDEYRRALQWDPKYAPALQALERIRKGTGLKR